MKRKYASYSLFKSLRACDGALEAYLAEFGRKKVLPEKVIAWLRNKKKCPDGKDWEVWILAQRSDVTLMFAKAGANINQRDYYRKTPLMETTFRGRDAVVKTLLDLGAKTRCKNFISGFTAREYANAYGFQKIVDLIDAAEKKRREI